MVTRDKAIEILKAHGVKPYENRTVGLNGKWAPHSSFDDEVGIKSTYKLMEILGWLGYCCRYC